MSLSFSPNGFEFDWLHFKEQSKDILISVFTEKAWLSIPLFSHPLFWFYITQTHALSGWKHFAFSALLLLLQCLAPRHTVSILAICVVVEF
ncbi:MAG: hypothetical protein R2728_14330 [Chitinophagales bacterium]